MMQIINIIAPAIEKGNGKLAVLKIVSILLHGKAQEIQTLFNGMNPKGQFE
jgi:hypothetical protein